ncbi:hypothetical protein D9M69_505500 [compost metagenome]
MKYHCRLNACNQDGHRSQRNCQLARRGLAAPEGLLHRSVHQVGQHNRQRDGENADAGWHGLYVEVVHENDDRPVHQVQRVGDVAEEHQAGLRREPFEDGAAANQDGDRRQADNRGISAGVGMPGPYERQDRQGGKRRQQHRASATDGRGVRGQQRAEGADQQFPCTSG